MTRLNVWRSDFATPDIYSLWLDDGELKYYDNGSWKPIRHEKVELPTKATTTLEGLVKQLPKEDTLETDASLEEVITKLNTIITKLRAAEIME